MQDCKNALIWATECDHPEIAIQLIDAGANVNVTDKVKILIHTVYVLLSSTLLSLIT